jgi:hypothetical protein
MFKNAGYNLSDIAAVTGGNVTGLWIDGIVTLSEPQTVTVDV